MLAVKLHKRKKPNLERGSHLVPLVGWDAGKIQVKRWLHILNWYNQGRPNNAIRYITLVHIPDQHPVFLGLHWEAKDFGVEFKPWCQWEQELKQMLKLAKKGQKALYFYDSEARELPVGYPIAKTPELILGARLPKKCILWTKDVRLLYGSGRRAKSGPEDLPNQWKL